MLAAFDAACCAANGVPLRDPRKPSEPELFHASTLPLMSEMVTIVLLKEACTCTSPCGTCLRSFFLNVFFLPFFSGAAAAPPAAVGFAIVSIQWSVVSGQLIRSFAGHRSAITAPCFYVFVVAFFFCATVPLRGPLRVRALVCVRWPRTGRFRRWRNPR